VRGIDPPSPLSPEKSVASAFSFSGASGQSYATDPQKPIRKHRFRTAPKPLVAHTLVEGYGPSPSSNWCAHLSRNSSSTLSLSSVAIRPGPRKPPREEPRVVTFHD